MESPASAPWPRWAFETGLLKCLDARGRKDVERAGSRRRLGRGELCYDAGELGDAFFVVLAGSVELAATRRGDESPSVIRCAERGQTFGEECALPGARRLARASAATDVELVGVPMAVFHRSVERAGGSPVAERELRALSRAHMKDLLATLAFARDLSEADRDLLLDGVRRQKLARGETLFYAGETAAAAYLIVDGLIQLQTEDDTGIWVRAYLAPGDLLGDEDALAESVHAQRAVALGTAECLEIPVVLLRTLADRNPRLPPKIRRVAAERGQRQARVVGDAAARSTQHVFHDVYRMQMARSLLVIDQEACVRCGHCSWSCAELYGVTRLIRRGDKVLTPRSREDDVKSLLLPNTCQHCKNPACMPDCPTGAIGRDPEGEVFIRAELCTGCGACVRGCPWDNIQLVERVAAKTRRPEAVSGHEGGARQASPLVAVKCDLCHEYEAPACVQACPTEAIHRVDPAEDFSELAALFGGPKAVARGAAAPKKARGRELPLSLALCVLLAAVGFSLAASERVVPAAGLGLASGWLAALGFFVLASYAWVKRHVLGWMRPRRRSLRDGALGKRARSRVAPAYRLHWIVGCVTAAAVALHGGAEWSVSVAGALGATFWLLAALGVLGGVAYQVLPERLARLERRGNLPEDLEAERARLVQQVYQRTSGRHALVKAVAEHVLLPYARHPLGGLMLLVSGRSLKRERARLRGEVAKRLDGAGDERLLGLEDLVESVVELRALPARRFASFLLRGFLVPHVLLAALAVTLLVIHALGALVR
ncbi:MAG TPA: cyclic nucleotide-binding domain-containing protein [Polyangiaceae bacterium]